jgi:hypothetical protein
MQNTRAILLPAGADFVTTASIPSLIACALYPDSAHEFKTITQLKRIAREGAGPDSMKWGGWPLEDGDFKRLNTDIWPHLPALKLPILEAAWKPYSDAFEENKSKLDWNVGPMFADLLTVRRIAETEHREFLSKAIANKQIVQLDPITLIPTSVYLEDGKISIDALTDFVRSFNLTVRKIQFAAPQDSDESRARWLDATMDAGAWWRADSILALHGAMLLSGWNPNTVKVEDADANSNAEMGPEDFRRLKNFFEGASKDKLRTLKDWAEYASGLGLKVHSWLDQWTAFIDTVNATNAAPLLMKGITKQQALIAFDSAANGKLKNALEDASKWIVDARVSKGTPGGRHKTKWNPVVMAIAIREHCKTPKEKLNQVFTANSFLREWREEWEEKSDY